MLLNSLVAIVALWHVSLAFHEPGDCNLEISTEASLSIDPKKDITEVTFVPSIHMSISNVHGSKFKPDLACNHYGLFVFFVVNAKGKEILRYPADVGSAISMWLMSSGKKAVSIPIDVEQNGTCKLQYVRNKIADFAYELIQTNTTDASNELYTCRYNVDQTFAYTSIVSTLYQLCIPYFQWNTFDTYCTTVGGKSEELLSQSLVSTLIFAISIILLATFPVLAAILPECPKAELGYYKKHDVPFSFRMLLMNVIHFDFSKSFREAKNYCFKSKRKCKDCCENDETNRLIERSGDNENQSTDNQNTVDFAHSFRYFILLIIVLSAFNTLVHYVVRKRDKWEFQLVHETLSNAAVPLEGKYRTQMYWYYGILAGVVAFLSIVHVYIFFNNFCRELIFKPFCIENMKRVYVISLGCKACFFKAIDVNMISNSSNSEYTFHTRCLKLLENSLFSYAFWQETCNGESNVCCKRERHGRGFERHESNECCLEKCKSCEISCADNCFCPNKCCCNFLTNGLLCVLAFIMFLINIPLVLVQSIPVVRAVVVGPLIILCEECKHDNRRCKQHPCCIGQRIGSCCLYIFILLCVHVLVCEIIIMSVQFVLQIIVFTFFVSVAFYPSASLPQITLILAFVKVLGEEWSEFQTDMKLVLEELFEQLKNQKPNSISKRAYAYVFEMINGPSIVLHFAKFLFLTFTFYVTYDAVIKGGIIKENWQTVFTSIFLFLTPDLLVKISGMTGETKQLLIREQLERFFKDIEYKQTFNKLNNLGVQNEMDRPENHANESSNQSRETTC